MLKMVVALALLAGCWLPPPYSGPQTPKGPRGPQSPRLIYVGQEYGEPIPSQPTDPANKKCALQCAKEHCDGWLRCGRAFPDNEPLRGGCRKRVADEHAKCHKRCDPGIS